MCKLIPEGVNLHIFAIKKYKASLNKEDSQGQFIKNNIDFFKKIAYNNIVRKSEFQNLREVIGYVGRNQRSFSNYHTGRNH